MSSTSRQGDFSYVLTSCISRLCILSHSRKVCTALIFHSIVSSMSLRIRDRQNMLPSGENEASPSPSGVYRMTYLLCTACMYNPITCILYIQELHQTKHPLIDEVTCPLRNGKACGQWTMHARTPYVCIWGPFNVHMLVGTYIPTYVRSTRSYLYINTSYTSTP